jgi:hypothetical protein
VIKISPAYLSYPVKNRPACSSFTSVCNQTITRIIFGKCFCALIRIGNRLINKTLRLLVFLVFSFPAFAQIPKLVHSKSLSASGESGNGFRIQYGGSIGTGSLGGNLLTLRITAPHGSTVSSILDNKGSTYTLGASVDSGAGGWITALYYVAGTPAGITQITVNYSSAVADWHGAVMEYSGIATNSPADGSCTNHSTSISCSTSTSASGDLVVATMIGLGSALRGNTLSTVTPGGSFILDAADTQASDADEEYVQPSAGPITPSFTVTGSSQPFNIVAMAFKAAVAGTNPTGMYILHQQHTAADYTGGTGSQNTYFVSSGNLLLASFELGPSFTTYSIAGCTPTNTWTKVTEGGAWPTFFYLTSTANFSTDLLCTVGTSGGSGGNGILVIYDVVGAAASPFDKITNGQSQGNAGFVSGTLTPDNAPGIFFGAANDGIGPVTQVGVSGTAGAIFDNTPYTGETDGGQLNNGDAWQHLFFNSTSTITYTWKMSNTTSWMQASGIAFLAGSMQGTRPAPPTGLQAKVQ